MHPEQENFDSLRRLLALKRHEVPPPGYFHGFSGQVIARIRAGEGRRSSLWESLSWEAPWLRRLWESFETKPIMAGVLGMVVCGFLVSGVVLSERAANPSVTTTGDSDANATGARIAFENGASPDTLNGLGITPERSFATTASFDGVRPAVMPAVFGVPSGN